MPELNKETLIQILSGLQDAKLDYLAPFDNLILLVKGNVVSPVGDLRDFKPCELKIFEQPDDPFILSQNACKNSETAGKVYEKGIYYETFEKDYIFKAASLNNLACAALWKNPRDPEKARAWIDNAYDILKTDETVEANYKTIHKYFPLPQKEPNIPEIPIAIFYKTLTENFSKDQIEKLVNGLIDNTQIVKE